MTPTKPHPYRCDWLEEARLKLHENIILFHDERFVKAIVIDEVIDNLKRERVKCHAAHSDAVTAEQRIEDVIVELRKFIDGNQCDGSCPFNEMNSDRCHTYKTCDLCVFDHAVESLRNGVEKK